MVENNIKSETELFAIADEQKTKAISDLLENTRKMGGSTSKNVYCSKQTCMKVIHEPSHIGDVKTTV